MKKLILAILLITFCTITDTVKATQADIKAIEGYSREVPLSYSGERYYVYGLICGTSCDKYGRNCQKGICNAKDCDTKNGYTQITISEGNKLGNDYVLCHNPSTNISYSVYSTYNYVEFYKDKIHCGENCDINGKNCSWGVCNVESCDINNGFTELKKEKKLGYFVPGEKHWVCHKPNSDLSYFQSNKRNSSRTFYYKEYVCGQNCDANGKNCKYENLRRPGIGICNPEDCPEGYEISIGMCKKIDGKKLLYKDRNGKFKNENIREKKENFVMGVGFTGYLIRGLTCSTLHLPCSKEH